MRQLKYSERLGEIQDKTFQLALERWGLGDLLSAQAIPFGLFGQNVFLNSTQGQYVFRGNPMYQGQFETERFMAEHLHTKAQVPVPWPYLVDASDDLFGWPYALMPRLRGLQLASPDVRATLSEKDRLELAELIGRNLARMHRLKQPYPGEYDPATDTVRPLTVTYVPRWLRTPEGWENGSDSTLSSGEVHQRWIESKIGFLLDRALQASDTATGRTTTSHDVEWISRILSDSKAALREPFQPCFVMHDYKEGNVVAEKTAGQWRITGVVDLMEAYFGDAEADLSRSLTEYGIGDKGSDARAYLFLDAYLGSREDPTVRPGFRERFAVYMLTDRLIGWSYGRKLGWFDGIPDFRTYCEPHLSLKPEYA